MNRIPLKDAKATLSNVLDEALLGHPSLITRHGRPEAVILSYAEWQKLSRVPSLGQLLAAAPAFGEAASRNETPARDVDL